MILALDVGNSNIKAGLFENGVLASSWRMTMDHSQSADEFGIKMVAFFRHGDFDILKVSGIIISSVVPSFNFTLTHMCSIYFGIVPIFVSNSLVTGLDIRYDNPSELGADRICNAVAALMRYEACIIVDFGTATTFSVIEPGGVFLGGCICPGVRISADALAEKAARLPLVELVEPERVIGANTTAGLQAGIIYGYIGMVDYIIRRMKSEMSACAPHTVATGGMARLIVPHSECISEDDIIGTLTLEGLYRLYVLNNS